MTLSPRLLTLLVATNLALLAVMVLTALTGCKPVQVSPARATFQELTAERINLVGADGKLVMALSNKARIAGPVMGGKAYSGFSCCFTVVFTEPPCLSHSFGGFSVRIYS